MAETESAMNSDRRVDRRVVRVGLMGEHPGWAQLLNQIGAPWSFWDPDQFGSKEESSESQSLSQSLSQSPSFSLLIIPLLLDAVQMQTALQWIDKNVAIIDCTGQFQDQMPVQSFVRSIKPNQFDAPFSLPMPAYVYDTCLTLRHGATGKGILRVQDHRPVAFFGWDPMHLFYDPDMTWRRFHHSSLPTTAERVARRPSYPLMMLVLQLLVEMHHRVGLPFAHFWWHPDKDRTPFTFRIDTDYGSEKQLTELYEVFREFEVPATWFMHTGVLKDLQFLSDFKDQEIAFHCEDHRQFRTTDGFRLDMVRGLKRLNKTLGRPVQGYAAPYGGWSDALHEVLDDEEHPDTFRFQYSSEFGYDYDGFPSEPLYTNTLQIPVHPISFGTLRRFGYQEDSMKEYIREWVDVKGLLHLPLHLYVHPSDIQPGQLREVLEMLSSEPLQSMTMSDYASMWRKRTSIASQCWFSLENNNLKCTGDIKWPVAVYPIDPDHSTSADGPPQRFFFSECNAKGSFPMDTLSQPKPHKHFEVRDLEWLNRRSDNNTLSWFRFRKYQYLSWLWRNKE